MTATKTVKSFTGYYGGTCNSCGMKCRVTTQQVAWMVTEAKRGWIACPAGCTYRRRSDGKAFPQTFPVAGIYGTYNPAKECNGQCMGAVGPACDCKCGGHNHGASRTV